MADRFVLKQFAGNATNNGAFGAAQATGSGVQPVANIKDVQSLNAFEQGWNSATLTADKLPALEEMQGLEALLCKAIKENYSEGIPLWISGETYYQDSRAVYNGKVYRNKTGSYTANNPANDTANWELDKPDTAGTADKLGSSNVGSSTQPMYLSSGIATASTATVGTATKPVYLSGGTITQGDELAKIDLSNINASGEQVVKNLITSSAANVDLSNLSATGNDKFVTKDTNQTISGNKDFTGVTTISGSNNNALMYINGKKPLAQTGGTHIAQLLFRDVNNKKSGLIQNIRYADGYTVFDIGSYNADGSGPSLLRIYRYDNNTGYAECPTPSSATDNSTKIATTAWVRNHRCTTAATTTSTASTDAPAYVVENYRNGYNWYRVWSDGWIEQGGYRSGGEGGMRQFNLNKAFAGTDYTILALSARGDGNAAPATTAQTINKTTTYFYAIANNASLGTYWYACGY